MTVRKNTLKRTKKTKKTKKNIQIGGKPFKGVQQQQKKQPNSVGPNPTFRLGPPKIGSRAILTDPTGSLVPQPTNPKPQISTPYSTGPEPYKVSKSPFRHLGTYYTNAKKVFEQ